MSPIPEQSRPGTYVGASADRGGTVVTGQAVGYQHNVVRSARRRSGSAPPADVGILTVLAEESDAVVEMLSRHRDYGSRQVAGGEQVHSAVVDAEGGGDLRVVAVQTLEPGPLSAAVAYDRLHSLCQPAVVLLVGVAGGVGDGVGIGDVVVADEVVCYDSRRETAEGPRRRGNTHRMTPALRHRVHELLRRCHGSIEDLDGDPIRIHVGPVGSGAAVITDADSDIVSYLRQFNEKVLAVETEAGGVGQAFYERVGTEPSLRGWLTVRGISDLADRHMGRQWHRMASRRAATVTEQLLPLLRLTANG